MKSLLYRTSEAGTIDVRKHGAVRNNVNAVGLQRFPEYRRTDNNGPIYARGYGSVTFRTS
jgi:hypothetical protein